MASMKEQIKGIITRNTDSVLLRREVEKMAEKILEMIENNSPPGPLANIREGESAYIITEKGENHIRGRCDEKGRARLQSARAFARECEAASASQMRRFDKVEAGKI